MAAYESDSSGARDDDFTETNVLLGYAAKKPTDDTISHLGGKPTWLDPATPPSAALARCKVCKDIMVLLLQLNGDLPEFFPGHDRRLYVLTCRRKTCGRKDGSVRALRGVKISGSSTRDKQKQNQEPKSKSTSLKAQPKPVALTSIGENLFGVTQTTSSGSSNPFSTSTSSASTTNPFLASTSLSNPFSKATSSSLPEAAAKTTQDLTGTSNLPQTFASALSLNTSSPICGPVPPPEPWPPEPELPLPFPTYYLVDADYETLDKALDDVSIPQHTMDIIDDDNSSSNQKEDKDAYESTIDKTFQRFADRLAQNPEQVIRYEFRGRPLLYSKIDAVGKLLAPSGSQVSKITVGHGAGGSRIPSCPNCGSGRVFETQLTPQVITELEAEELNLEGMEWGTIVVGVCEKDCAPNGTNVGDVGYLEEWAGVQWEEVSERRR